MIIDGHAHAAGPFRRADTLRAALDGLEVDRVVLSQNIRNDSPEIRLPFENTEITRNPLVPFAGNRFIRMGARLLRAEDGRIERNREVRALAEECRGRVIPFYWANPGRDDLLEEVFRAVERDGFRGIKLHQGVTPFPIDSESMTELASFASGKKTPIFIHLYSRPEVRKFADLALAHPRTIFIIAHLIGVEILAPRAKELRNVYWDTSPAWGSPVPRVKFALDAFGADRVMLGSDTPFGRNTLKRNIVKIESMDIPAADKALILGGNASRLFD
jgi:uncharacterized protein